jgi:trigger factor
LRTGNAFLSKRYYFVTLTIETAEDSQRQLTMTIQVPEDRVQKAMREKARTLSREITLPGFRPGKAPYDVVVRRVGEETLRAEAIEDLIQPVFEEAMDQANAEMYGRPSLDDIESNPLVFKFTIPLEPQVTLGDYRSRRKEITPVEVSDEALEEALQYAQNRHQTLEVVDRPAQPGDVVTIGGRGTLKPPAPAEGEEAPAETDDEVIFDEERVEVLLETKTLFPETPFVDHIVGMSVGDQKTFSFTFGEDYELEKEFSGREATFDITVLEVKNRELPPLDDELAKLEGDYETFDQYRESLREELARAAESNQKDELVNEMIEWLVEDATMVYPPAAVDVQIDEMVSDFKTRLQRSGWKVEDYLQLQGITEETLREEFRENAERQMKNQLALRQFILDEKLRVEVADIDGLIEDRVARFDNDELKKSMREYYRSGRGFEAISSEVLRDKVYERTKAILLGQAPDLDAPDAAGEATEAEEAEEVGDQVAAEE